MIAFHVDAGAFTSKNKNLIGLESQRLSYSVMGEVHVGNKQKHNAGIANFKKTYSSQDAYIDRLGFRPKKALRLDNNRHAVRCGHCRGHNRNRNPFSR